ncbi:transglutaminaseTgpA domain-containing protein [Pseudoalteromonas sp. SMS1]|uniref:transglutaminase family protein n=1 Tax=Pseudoalteromonas sp. SMS1 TaxID=2908894 RepID=UPI001F3CCD29|nr:transglutaminaseTgpA domain-containing protein [Pseudoalteromonas sp. SMS1]MCF2855892.1 transglutaminaseTgpA domain-containing protein [Pseudoalteromonas sp. SMS1]
MSANSLVKRNTLITSLIYCAISLLLFQSLGYVFCVSIVLVTIFKVSTTIGAVKNPSKLVVNLLAVTVIVVVFLSLGLKNTIEMFVAMLIGACALKMLQVTSAQQATSAYILNFFTYPCFYLFSQNILAFAFVAGLLLFNLAQLFSVSHNLPIKTSYKSSVKKFIFSLPLAVAMVLLVPKLPPFWQLPNAKSANTGLSEDVDPFEITELSRSSELAFRALLPAADIFQPPFYWRAIVHDRFDGKKWQMSRLQGVGLQRTYQPMGPTYSVIAEPSNTRWLFTLGDGIPASKGMGVNHFGTIFQKKLSNKPVQYEVSPVDLDDARLSRWEYAINVQLPEGYNPQAIELAKKWDSETGSTQEFITRMKSFFVTGGFNYSLSPPAIRNKHNVDEFLFSTQSGFCGHYASSAAFLMRTAGIPTRLVSGYLGGEFNQQSNYYAVYQYDAHAWVEYYVPQQGWLRLDPTAWVAPDRMFGSLSDLAELEQEFKDNLGISLASFSNIRAINWVRLQLEQLDFHWTRWVLNFDDKKQSSLLKALFGAKHNFLPALSVVLILIATFGGWFAYLNYRKWKSQAKEIRLYNRLLDFGKVQASSLTPKQSIELLKQKFPRAQAELSEFYTLFESARYNTESLSREQYKRLSFLNRRIIKKAKIK